MRKGLTVYWLVGAPALRILPAFRDRRPACVGEVRWPSG